MLEEDIFHIYPIFFISLKNVNIIIIIFAKLNCFICNLKIVLLVLLNISLADGVAKISYCIQIKVCIQLQNMKRRTIYFVTKYFYSLLH